MAIENFSWLLLDTDNDPVVGANPLPTITLRRLADNFIFDWADNTFKDVGWGTKAQDLAELDAVNFSGTYEVDLNLAGFEGLYYAYVSYLNDTSPQHSVNQFGVTDGVVVGTVTGLTAAQEAKIDAIPITDSVADLSAVLAAIAEIPTTDNVADLTPVLNALALIPTTNSVADLTPVLQAVAAIPTTDSVADLTGVLTAIAAIPTTPLLNTDNRLDKIATIPSDVWGYTQ